MPRSRWFAPLLAVVLLTSAEAAMATQKDPALDGLFQRLTTIDDPVAAAALQQTIWETWIKADTTELDALMRQGMVQMARQRLDDAVETFSHLIEKAPDFAEAWNKRATVHFLRGDMAASVADIRRTVALEPRHFGAWSGLGMIMVELGRPADAVKAYEEALKYNPHIEGLREHIEKLRVAAGERKT